MKKTSIWLMTFLIALLAIIWNISPHINNFLLRKKFHVYNEGVVLVTGCSSGIGNEIALELAKNNYTVFAGVRTPEAAWNISKNHPKIMPVHLDVTKEGTINAAHRAVMDYMRKSGLPFVGVVNNAGIGAHSTIEYHDIDKIQYLFDVDLFGIIRVTKRFLDLLRTYKGRIVNISSLAGVVTQPREGVYSAAKFGVEAISDALRRELWARNVSVSIIEPGFIHTPILVKILDTEKEMAECELCQKYYQDLYTEKQLKKFTSGAEKASPPSKVAKVVLSALFDPYPQTRYTAGNVGGIWTGFLVRIIRILPDRLMDRILLM